MPAAEGSDFALQTDLYRERGQVAKSALTREVSSYSSDPWRKFKVTSKQGCAHMDRKMGVVRAALILISVSALDAFRSPYFPDGKGGAYTTLGLTRGLMKGNQLGRLSRSSTIVSMRGKHATTTQRPVMNKQSTVHRILSLFTGAPCACLTG